MRIQIKRALLRAATAAAIICTAAVILTPVTASAASATASANVNVRAAPSTTARVVDRLTAGETIDVRGCREGWCYIEHNGPAGYVSASYVRRGGAAIGPNFNLSFAFPQGNVSIGTGGVSIGVGTPSQPNRPGNGNGNGHGNDHGNQAGGGNRDQVCFYTSANYRGDSFCMSSGDQQRYIGRDFNDRISSIRNRSGQRVTVCEDAGYNGCRTYSTSAADLGSFDNEISSIRVR